jgi:flagellar biosynthesis/type III secretory pathway M-ring protein FliF/YscJ
MAREMQKVAEKTEKETTSMHIITLVTLVFLPGTFVAVSWFIFQLVAAAFSAGAERDPSLTNTDSQTFFGSGLFQWDDNDPEMALPKWRPEFFKLFSLICFPLMAGTILVWLLVFRIAKQRGRRAADNRLVDDMAQSEV